MRELRAFYSFRSEPGGDVPGDCPVPFDASLAPSLVGRMKHHKDFFGLIDQEARTLQVRFSFGSDGPIAGEGDYWVELIDEPRRGSHVRRMTNDELTSLLSRVPETFDAAMLPGATFRPW